MGLDEVLSFLETLNARAMHYSIGRYDNRKEKTIFVYNSPDEVHKMPIGGPANRKTLEKPVSILVHWNKNYKETEEFSLQLFEELEKIKKVVIGNYMVSYIQLMQNAPIDVENDENGIFERMIDLVIYYEKQEV